MSDIDIYVDGADRASIMNFLKNGTTSAINLKYSKDFNADQAKNQHENLVMFVTGHGDIQGLDANPPIAPYALLNTIKSSPNLKQAIIYLGQCYAGVFNYVSAGNAGSNGAQSVVDVILMGATNLHESLSLSTSETLLSGQQQWIANTFLLYVFKWFAQPEDVDGDGSYTIIDSYKYAGAHSNIALKKYKVQSFPRTSLLEEAWRSAASADQKKSTPLTQAELQAAYDRYLNHLHTMYTHQECWILNARPAQQIQR